MSTCISRHGEYSSHDPDEDYICRLCAALDEDALIAEVRALRARLAVVEADRDQLIDRLTTAKALHVPQAGQGPAYCQDCDQRWPCPTRAALAAPTDTTKEN